MSNRNYLIAGNWKMNLNREESLALVRGLKDRFPEPVSGVDIGICPVSVYLDAVGQMIGSVIRLGAQNMYHEPSGAFTGEISASMIKDVGCHYVILGHSERRSLMAELDQAVNLKTLAALEAGLTPIVCVGETLEQRESGRTAEVVAAQFQGSLKGLEDSQVTRLVIAYEPVWAIGTGKVATPEQAEQVHADLRKTLENHYNPGVADRVQILYGGSVKPGNAPDLLAQPNVDGALVGGASLDVDSFSGIVEAAARLKSAQ